MIFWKGPEKSTTARSGTELSIFLRRKPFYIVTRRLLTKSPRRQ
jgi:hypothetical protein